MSILLVCHCLLVATSLDRPLDQSVSVSGRLVRPSRSQSRVAVTSEEPFSIRASVRGVPEPAISWSRDDVDITPSDRISMTTTTVGDRTVSTLTVSGTNAGDAGRYAFQASGDSGTVSDSVDVTVKRRCHSFLIETVYLYCCIWLISCRCTHNQPCYRQRRRGFRFYHRYYYRATGRARSTRRDGGGDVQG